MLFTPARFPDSDISGSTLVCQLPGAFRRLPRPSSPLDAKTSTVHPYSLDHVYRSPPFPGPKTLSTGGAATTTRLAEKVPDDTRPTEKQNNNGSGDHSQCRGGRRGLCPLASPGRLKPKGRRTTYYLEPRHSLVKEQSVFCGASFGGRRNRRQTSRRTRVSQPCLVGGLIRVRQMRIQFSA